MYASQNDKFCFLRVEKMCPLQYILVVGHIKQKSTFFLKLVWHVAVLGCHFVRQNFTRSCTRFLKPHFKGKHFAGPESERGKFDFDHHFAFLTGSSLKDRIFAWRHLCQLVKWIIFKRKFVQNGSSFRFCKIGLRNTLFIFGRKMVVTCCFVCLFCFVATLSFFKIEALIELRKMLLIKIIRCTAWELLNP